MGRTLGWLPDLCGCRPVASWLRGPSCREDLRGAHARPRVVPPLQPRLGLCLCGLAASIPPRMATDARMGRGNYSPCDRARVSVHGGLGDYPARLDAG